MKEQLLLISILCVSSLSLSAQSLERSVLASDGSTNSIGSISLEWTLGEMAIATLLTEDGMLTQGFHQPLLTVSTIITEEEFDHLYTVQVMPNPVSSLLNVHVASQKQEPVMVQLLDINGKIIKKETINFPFDRLQFDMTRYPSGLYIVRVATEDNRPIGLFKVNKLD